MISTLQTNSQWTRKYDDGSGYHYFLNNITGESKWDENEYNTEMNPFDKNDMLIPMQMTQMTQKNAPKKLEMNNATGNKISHSDKISLMFCLHNDSEILNNIEKKKTLKKDEHIKHFKFLDPLVKDNDTTANTNIVDLDYSNTDNTLSFLTKTTKDINYDMLKAIQLENDEKEVENDELIATLLSTFDPYHADVEPVVEATAESSQNTSVSTSTTVSPTVSPSEPLCSAELCNAEPYNTQPLIQTDDYCKEDTITTELIDKLVAVYKSTPHIMKQKSPLKQTKPRKPMSPPSYPPPERPSLLDNPKSFFYLQPPKIPPKINSTLNDKPNKPTTKPPELTEKEKLFKEEIKRHRENMETLKKISENINSEMQRSFETKYKIQLDSPNSYASSKFTSFSPESSVTVSDDSSSTDKSIFEGMHIYSPSNHECREHDKSIICKKIVKSDSEIPINPEGMVRQHGFLMGYIYIRVTTKKIMKKWSKRYFTLRDGILKLWKNKDHSSNKKAEREINLVNYERKLVDSTNSTKNLDRYMLSDIKLYYKTIDMNFFDIVERVQNKSASRKNITILTVGSKMPQALKTLRDDMNILIKF